MICVQEPTSSQAYIRLSLDALRQVRLAIGQVCRDDVLWVYFCRLLTSRMWVEVLALGTVFWACLDVKLRKANTFRM